MFCILYLLPLIVFQGSYAQNDCVPDDVRNVTLDLNYTLYWEESTNCDRIYYLVYILVEDDIQHIYTTDYTYLNVSFLPACEMFHFQVMAISGNVISTAVSLNEYVPAPSGADLTLTYFRIAHGDQSITLHWQVTEKFAHCARGFRVVIRDEWYVPRDIYTTENNITIDNLVPCGDYTFGVMAIYNVVSEGPIVSLNYVYPAANASLPILNSVVPADTSVDLRWTLSPYSANRCPITSFVIDGSPYFNQIYPIQDSPARPPLTTTVRSLRPDTMYFFRAYVVNSAGSSSAFQIAVNTLPANQPGGINQ